MVGLELADLLRERSCAVQVLELQAGAANGMARNNRFELLERLAAAGIRVITNCRIDGIAGRRLEVRIGEDEPSLLPVGDALVFATGPRPSLDVLEVVEASGIPHARVGDCNVPGDFLSGLRDAWMVGLAIDAQPARARSAPARHAAEDLAGAAA